MTDSKLHMAGIIATVVVHLGVGLAINAVGSGDDDDGDRPNLAEREVIETALAYKKTTKKKKRQPQKKRNPRVKPKETVGVSRDADKKPEPQKDKDRKPPPKDFVDPSATLDKFRKIDIDEEPNDIAEEDEERGSEGGSEWGTADVAKGDAYLGELAGRLKAAWAIPTVEKDRLVTVGCVTVSAKGEALNWRIDKPSGDPTLDRSVEEALRNFGGMSKPAPPYLLDGKSSFTRCIKFNPEE